MATSSPSLLSICHVQSSLGRYTMQRPQVCSIFSEQRTACLSELLNWWCDGGRYCLRGRRLGKPVLGSPERSDSGARTAARFQEVETTDCEWVWNLCNSFKWPISGHLGKFCKTVLEAVFPGTAVTWVMGNILRPPITVEPVQHEELLQADPAEILHTNHGDLSELGLLQVGSFHSFPHILQGFPST